mmetsp:Transcript_5288/g.6890  ORF Transcript_5288/g.6890 Transcript_5288/m.6890 type:complete len:402 (+) Transcript_5288:87-1292(+)
MGASASVLIDGAASEDQNISEEERQTLESMSSVLKTYKITSKEDLELLKTKFSNMKAAGIHGLALLQGLHLAMHEIAHRVETPQDRLANAVIMARQRVSILMKQVSFENYANFMIGIDGSRASNNAYEVCLTELVKSRDGLIGMHCYDSTKSDGNLSNQFKPEPLKKKFDVDLTARSNLGRYSLLWLDKKGQRTDQFVLKTVNEICENREKLDPTERPSFFVTGYTGRKKALLDDKKKIGSLSLLAAGHLLIPTIIIKNEPILDRGRIFVCCIKNNEHYEPYNVCYDLIKPGQSDKIFVIHIHKDDSGVMNSGFKDKRIELESYFNKRMKTDGLLKNGSKFISYCNKDGVPNLQMILQALEELEADYVVINPHIQVTGAIVPNNCENIISGADCNIVICPK